MNNRLSLSKEVNVWEDHENYPGIDLEAAETWIYPTNYPVREYQFNIVQKALFKNTLVSLPTGLGKTFIAAVVMYNFHRWYPNGKIIFMAPTRPLVKQQIDACYDIMAIPKKSTAELTGVKVSTSREDTWNDKRIFFITPQILQNDLENIIQLGSKIRCLIFDEAHKARGNYAYCEVIRKLIPLNKHFRVLALSATPGASISDVLEVIQNLLISHLEFRTEESLDVSPYAFHRNITTVVVPLGEKLQQVKEDYLQVLDYHTRTLIKHKVIQGNCGSLTKGKIFVTLKNFQQNCRGTGAPNYTEIVKCLNICITLYHAFELLVRHGLRSFLTFFEEHINNPLLRGNIKIMNIMDDVKNYLGPTLTMEQLPNGEYCEVPNDVKFGHPKFYKLQDILLRHFKEEKQSSKVIVFFEYRESVIEAYALLQRSKPLLRPRIFLGQKNGITQRSQINVVKAFREGQCNILLSTSIGEEGLDVGEVDLIICFDISNKSPIRLVQRIGRTGRKREGSVIILVTEGKEQQTLKDCLIHKNNIAQHVLASNEIAKNLCFDSPRMIPITISPKCEQIFITVEKVISKKANTLKNMLRNISDSSESVTFSPDLEILGITERIPKTLLLWNKCESVTQSSCPLNILNSKIQAQRSFQEYHKVKHSKDCQMLVNLLQWSDSKRYNINSTQIGESGLTKNLKQTDIRNMFKSQSSSDLTNPIVKTLTANQGSGLIPNEPDKNPCYSKRLFNEISDYLSIKILDRHKICRNCPKSFECKIVRKKKSGVRVNWTELDDSIYSSVTDYAIKSFKQLLNKRDSTFNDDIFEDSVNFDSIEIPNLIVQSQKILELDDLIDESIRDTFLNESCNFQKPKSFNKLLSKYTNCEVNMENKSVSSDIFEDVSITQPAVKNILGFFKLNSLKDIYDTESTDFEAPKTPEKCQESPQKTQSNELHEAPTVSPVLWSSRKRTQNSKVDKIISYSEEIPSKIALKGCEDESKNNWDLEDICDMPFFGLEKQAIESQMKTSFDISTDNISNPINTSNSSYLENISDNSETTSIKQTLAAIEKGKPNIFSEFEDLCDISILPDIKENTNVNISKANKKYNNVQTIKNHSNLNAHSILNDTDNTLKDHILNQRLTPENNCKSKTRDSLVSETFKNTIPSPKTVKQDFCESNESELFSTPFNSKVTPVKKSKTPINPLLNTLRKSPKMKTHGKIMNTSSTKLKSFQENQNTHNISFRERILYKGEHSNCSDDEFEPKQNRVLSSKKQEGEKGKKLQKIRNQKKVAKDFIDDEAELSLCDTIIISDDEEDAQNDQSYDVSFIEDGTQNDDSQMHMRYIQSVKSPVINNKGFKIPLRKIDDCHIYSQEVDNTDDTYLEDSFVTHTEDCDIVSNEYSQLEILEMKLKRKRRKKSEIMKPTKRRRIIEDYSDDSD